MKPVILLVDDEVDLVEVLVEALGFGLPDYDVQGASSLAEGRSVVSSVLKRDQPLSLVIADHHLGKESGMTLLEEVHDQRPDVPLMLFTGQASTPVAAQAATLGARVLWKPVRLRQLLDEVRGLL